VATFVEEQFVADFSPQVALYPRNVASLQVQMWLAKPKTLLIELAQIRDQKYSEKYCRRSISKDFQDLAIGLGSGRPRNGVLGMCWMLAWGLSLLQQSIYSGRVCLLLRVLPLSL
jgi:hypothetical protein